MPSAQEEDKKQLEVAFPGGHLFFNKDDRSGHLSLEIK